MNDILCTTDLTAASDTALRHAALLAEKLNSGISVLHVLGKGERSTEERAKVDASIKAQVAKAASGARVRVLMPEGDFIDGITKESGKDHRFLVMGTHGPHGLRQSLFGADILKLVRRSVVPSFVVQEKSPVGKGMDKIIMPVAGHADIHRLVDGVCALAKAFDSEVHVFQLMRPNEQPSDELLKNKVEMLTCLEKEGIKRIEVNIPSSGFSIGFAAATIEYGQKIGAGAIAIMAHASDEYRFIADAEKERILTNDALIPVLCG